MAEPVYWVFDADGNLTHEAADVHEAKWEANQQGPYQLLTPPQDESSDDLRENPVTPERALELTGLEPVYAPPYELSEDDAWRIVQSFVRERDHAVVAARKFKSGEVYERDLEPWDQASFLRAGMLATNTKLEKVDESKPPAVSRGLNLLPEHGVFRGRVEGWDESQVGPAFPHMKKLSGYEPGKNTFCHGSTSFCRASCLVYSGNHASDIRNNQKKFALSKMLLKEPRAFARLLMGAVDRYAQWRPKDGRTDFRRFVRFNMLSDIPIELWAGWLLDYCLEREIIPYDYTKVEGRTGYDLSFSYGGTPASLAACDRELRRGHRVVMVFIADPESHHGPYMTPQAAKAKYGPKGYYLRNPLPEFLSDPALLGGEPIKVLDGDVSDIRPYDEPGKHIVGLRFKPPQVIGAGDKHPENGFVIRGEIVGWKGWRGLRLPETPLSRPGVVT